MKIFITGIDTDSGKTVVTGLIARHIIRQQKTVITQKYIQTGCEKIADDLKIHRQLMDESWLSVDERHLTCSYVFKYPASPHLSAEMEDTKIDIQKITTASESLAKDYEYVLMEGAGGLMVPLNSEVTLLDYVQEQSYPCILVANSKLGSINHSLLSIETLKNRGIKLMGVVYNQYPNTSPFITKDSEKTIKHFLKQYFPEAGFVSIPEIDFNSIEDINFSSILGF